MVYEKNLEQTITMFVDEFKDEEVSLVLNNQAKNSSWIENEQNKNLMLCCQYDKSKLKYKIYLPWLFDLGRDE